jgi:hypothetical protein
MIDSGGGVTNLVSEQTAFYGRTLTEYQQVFNLDISHWRGRTVLDCPAGVSSFVSEANRQGVRAVACDPQYGRDVHDLADLARTCMDRLMENLRRNAQSYNWTFYSSIPAVRQYRLAALERFIRDYPAGLIEGRYVKSMMSSLPFADRSFDLVLSWNDYLSSEPLDYPIGLAGVLELFRVSRTEVRIYPNRWFDPSQLSPIDRLVDDLVRQDLDIDVKILPTSFEFRKGVNRLLQLTRK